MSIKPLGDRLLLQRCMNDDIRDESGEVLIALPEPTKDATEFCVVEAVGPKCKEPWRVGMTVRVMEPVHNDLQCIDLDEQLWIAREHLIEQIDYSEAVS